VTIFELVRIALDELYREGKKQYGKRLDETIRERMRYLSDSYARLTDAKRQPVDYKDPATRFAYVYKYVAAHGDYLVQIMHGLREELGSAIFQSESVRVTCIGGGPGSDIIAVLKFLDELAEEEPVNKVKCYLLDKEQAWADTWTELDDSLDLDLQLNANFQPLDVTAPDSWKSQQKFLQADLFTMSYFVSEVRSLDKDGVVTKFWKTVFKKAKPGALFIFDDNGHEHFTEYFDKQWKDANLECVLAKDSTRFIPRFSEQASELGDYLEKFEHSPKIQSNLSYRVLRKPRE
jgi:hypothetical protein